MHPRKTKPLNICIQGPKQTLLLHLLIKRKFTEFNIYNTKLGIKCDLVSTKNQDSFILTPDSRVTNDTNIVLLCPNSKTNLEQLIHSAQTQINHFDAAVHIILAEKNALIDPRIVNQYNIPLIIVDDSIHPPAILQVIKDIYQKLQPREKIHAFLSGLHPTLKSNSSLKGFAKDGLYDKNLRNMILEFAFKSSIWKNKNAQTDEKNNANNTLISVRKTI